MRKAGGWGNHTGKEREPHTEEDVLSRGSRCSRVGGDLNAHETPQMVSTIVMILGRCSSGRARGEGSAEEMSLCETSKLSPTYYLLRKY